MEIQRNVGSWSGWRDATHEAICDIFASENEQQRIYKRIQGLLIGNTHSVKMTNSGFFRHISKIFQKKYSKPLPEDLVLEIVSRLPAEDVLKCLVQEMDGYDPSSLIYTKQEPLPRRKMPKEEKEVELGGCYLFA